MPFCKALITSYNPIPKTAESKDVDVCALLNLQCEKLPLALIRGGYSEFQLTWNYPINSECTANRLIITG